MKLYPSTMFVIIPESTNVYIFDAVSDTNGDDKAYLLLIFRIISFVHVSRTSFLYIRNICEIHNISFQSFNCFQPSTSILLKSTKRPGTICEWESEF